MATAIRGNTQIKSGTIFNAQIASSAEIAVSKLEALTSSGIVFTDSNGYLTATMLMGGDITWSGSGFDIGTGVIVDADINGSAAISTSKLADGSLFLKSDGSVAMSMGNLNLGSNKIINLADAENSGDAVNKGQLDAAVTAAVAGLDSKDPVRVVATSNITLSGLQTIDGVLTIANDRIGVTGQTDASQNGIYLSGITGWTRTTDADDASETTKGMFFIATEGTNYQGTGWVLTNTPGFLGMDDLNFIQIQAPNSTIGGAGLTKTGNTLDVVSGNGGIVVNVNDITLTVDATADSLSVGSGGVKLKDGSSADIYVANGSGVFTRVGVSGDITLSNAGVAAIASGVIVNADINASAAIALSKLASGSSAQIIVCNGSGVPTYVAMSGDITIDNTGATTIGSGVIVNADINAGAAIALSKLASGTAGYIVQANGSGVATYTEVTGDVTINSSGVTAIGSGVIVNADINASAAIALSKLASGTAGYVVLANGSGVATYTEITGDVTVNSSGVTAIGSGVIVNADISGSAAIALSKLASGTAGYLVVCNGSGVPTYVEMTGDATISDAGVVTVTATGLVAGDFTCNEVVGTGDGMTTDFALAATPETGKQSIYLNGLLQRPGGGQDYTISGDTISFATAPESGDVIMANYIVQ